MREIGLVNVMIETQTASVDGAILVGNVLLGKDLGHLVVVSTLDEQKGDNVAASFCIAPIKEGHQI